MRRKRRRRQRRGEEGSSKKRNNDDIMWPSIPEIFIICFFAENICDLCTGAWSSLLTCALFEGIDKQRGAQ